MTRVLTADSDRDDHRGVDFLPVGDLCHLTSIPQNILPGMLTVFQGQRVLKDVNQCLAPCQAAFAIEQEIPKAHVACFSQRSCLTDSRKSAIHVIRLKLLSCDPSKHFCGTMASIFSLLVRKMLLIVVVTNPFFVRCEQVFPGFRRLKIPISHASLDVNYVELLLPLVVPSPHNTRYLAIFPGAQIPNNV